MARNVKDARLRSIQTELREVTKTCRPDMHEPDQQDLKCHVVGNHLDNAFGGHVSAESIINGFQEFVVCFERFEENTVHDPKNGGKGKFIRAQINLADLIALARLA